MRFTPNRKSDNSILMRNDFWLMDKSFKNESIPIFLDEEHLYNGPLSLTPSNPSSHFHLICISFGLHRYRVALNIRLSINIFCKRVCWDFFYSCREIRAGEGGREERCDEGKVIYRVFKLWLMKMKYYNLYNKLNCHNTNLLPPDSSLSTQTHGPVRLPYRASTACRLTGPPCRETYVIGSCANLPLLWSKILNWKLK